MDELMLKVLEDPNRIINGDQYNDLYKYFTQNMTDEAARSFLAANYMMTHDFYSQYVNNGYLENDLRLTSGLNDGIRKVEVQQRIGALAYNLTPEIEQNTQSQYAQETIQAAKAYYPQANTSEEQDTQDYSSANTDWQDLNQDLNYSVADGNEEIWNHEKERRQDQPQDNQSDTKWSDFLLIQGIVSKLSSEHFDEDGSRKSNQAIEIQGNVDKVSDGELVITANGSVIDTVQKISGFSLPSEILDKSAIETVVDQYKDYKVNADKFLGSWKYAPFLVGATYLNLGLPTTELLNKVQTKKTAIPKVSQSAEEIGVVAKESNNYTATFFTRHPDLQGKVVVHHAVEQQVLRRPETIGLFTKNEINAYNNLRGIPKEINSKLHFSDIRKEWNKFYRENPFPSKEDLLRKRQEIDMKYGSLFNPPIE